MPWSQVYDPLHNTLLSTLAAALPVIILLGSLAIFRVKAHVAALLGLASAFAVAVAVFSMPLGRAVPAALLGAVYGLFPIGWIILNVIFLYRLTVEAGAFESMKRSLTGIAGDRRLQLLLIAFCFGAFFEGAAGFGTPVAVTAAILIGLGFGPLQASGLSLVANTAPVAFGALGTPLVALAGVTGLDLRTLSAMVGRQLPLFSILVPFWLIWAFAGFRRMVEVWPALLVAGGFFAIPQFLISNYHGPWLAGVMSAVVSMAALVLFLTKWKPRREMTDCAGTRGCERAMTSAAADVKNSAATFARETPGTDAPAGAVSSAMTATAAVRPATGPIARSARRETLRAWLPWAILSLVIFVWGIPEVKATLDGVWAPRVRVPGLHDLVTRVPPVVDTAAAEPAVFSFNLLSFTGTGILVAAIASAFVLGFRPRRMIAAYGETLRHIRFSLLTVAAMLSVGYLTRYSGLDATLGLAFARTGVLYPFFGTLLGWLGVALTGSDTSSNVLFGSLQRISARQLGLSPVLMAAANSSGGVMGKMIDAQSIVVASTATHWYGHEGDILRFVFLHSLALAALVGILVTLQAYVEPFVRMVLR